MILASIGLRFGERINPLSESVNTDTFKGAERFEGMCGLRTMRGLVTLRGVAILRVFPALRCFTMLFDFGTLGGFPVITSRGVIILVSFAAPRGLTTLRVLATSRLEVSDFFGRPIRRFSTTLFLAIVYFQ